MNDINSVGDLIAAGAHWIADAFQRAGRGVRSYYSRLTERFGEQLKAPRPAQRQVWDITANARAAAVLLESGVAPTVDLIPILPGLSQQGQFRTEGVITLEGSLMSAEGTPLKTTLPFMKESSVLPTMGQLRSELTDYLNQADSPGGRTSPKGSKRRQRAAYLRHNDDDVTYDITPYFIFRTH